MPDLDKIVSIAKKVRAEQYEDCDDTSFQCRPYSLALVNSLKKEGISSKIVRGVFLCEEEQYDVETGEEYTERDHYWVETGGHIIDITADQFKSCMGDDFAGMLEDNDNVLIDEFDYYKKLK